MKRIILSLIAVLILTAPAYAETYIESLFIRIDRELEIDKSCKDIDYFLQQLSKEYDNMDKKQKEKFDKINKGCQKKICKQQAKEKYAKLWNRECKNRGLKDDCSLNVEVAKSLDEMERFDITACKDE